MKAKQGADRREWGDLFEQLDKWATFILANLLWIILSIPLVTLPAATAGLFAVMSGWARGKRPELFQEFFGAMRRHWRTSTLIVLLDLLIGGLLAVNLSIFPLMGTANLLGLLSRSVTLFVGLVLVLANLYAWPLLVTLELSPRPLLLNSLKLVFAHPLWSLGMLIAALVPVVASLLLPAAVLVMFSFSAFAFVVNWGAWRIIRRYLSDEERQKLEAQKQSSTP